MLASRAARCMRRAYAPQELLTPPLRAQTASSSAHRSRAASSLVASFPSSLPAGGSRPDRQSRVLPALPLLTRPHFPHVLAPMMVSEPAVAASLLGMRDAGLKYIGLFLHREAGSFSHDNEAELVADDFASPDKLHRVGVLAEVLRATPRAPGVELTLLCHHRIRWTNVVDADAAQADTAETAEYDIAGAVLADAAEAGAKNGNEETAKGGKSGGAPGKTLMKLHTEPMTELPVDPHSQHIKALTLALTSVMKESLAIGSFFKEQLELLLQTVDIKSPAALADLGASLTTAEGSKLQAVLEECDVEERLRLTLELLKVDLETTKVSRRIHERIEKTVSESQKRYFLQQQLVQIKRELGMEQDEKTSLITKFRERLADKTVPAAAMTIIEEGIEKLGSLEPASSEYSVTRNHLDWLTQVPWGKFSVDTLDLLRAQSVLDADHHGLKEVKERVLEFIAVSKLRGSLHGNILLLHGPPGVGKTSIAKTIAKSLSREYYRFSVGGLGDVSELKGHRRTYVGSVPGRFVVALKQTQVSNPIICIDEIDKLGRGWSGSPASALLETLDPEQNAQFLDAYLDTPIDLSNVLFVCTANSLDTIPGPLLDRMQHISLPGYILEEKVAIALTHLIPTAREESGLTEDQIRIERSAVEALARDYCREAGVRNLKRQLEKIFRKAALHVARSEESQEESKEFLPIVVSDETLESFVGKPVFSREKMYEAGTAPPGVALGLAWTQLGGRTLHIESVQVADRASRGTAAAKGKRSSSGESPGDGKMKVTGMLGEVMRESSDIAFSYVRSLLRKLEPDNKFFDTASVHVHVPDGGTPKDGPSAGCAMVTAMLSLARGISVSSEVALTGEISLTGKVLPVGGILSKVIAAKEAGVKHVVLPKGNVKDWEEIPEEVRDGIIVHFAVQYDEDVLPICFPTKPVVTNDGVELSGESERAETPRPSAAAGG